MTNTITVRLRRPKAEVLARAKPNVNAWVNDLIDQALGQIDVDWAGHFERRRQCKPVDRYYSDELRNLDR